MASGMSIWLTTPQCFEPELDAALHTTHPQTAEHRAQLLLSARTVISMYCGVGQNSAMESPLQLCSEACPPEVLRSWPPAPHPTAASGLSSAQLHLVPPVKQEPAPSVFFAASTYQHVQQDLIYDITVTACTRHHHCKAATETRHTHSCYSTLRFAMCPDRSHCWTSQMLKTHSMMLTP